jgi:hypothetical protein
MKKSYKDILAEYGAVAVVVYLAIFALWFAVCLVAIRLFGWRPTRIGSGVGVFVAAYLITKLFQPVRIAATLVLTPLVARGYERMTGRGRKAGT